MAGGTPKMVDTSRVSGMEAEHRRHCQSRYSWRDAVISGIDPRSDDDAIRLTNRSTTRDGLREIVATGFKAASTSPRTLSAKT